MDRTQVQVDAVLHLLLMNHVIENPNNGREILLRIWNLLGKDMDPWCDYSVPKLFPVFFISQVELWTQVQFRNLSGIYAIACPLEQPGKLGGMDYIL